MRYFVKKIAEIDIGIYSVKSPLGGLPYSPVHVALPCNGATARSGSCPTVAPDKNS